MKEKIANLLYWFFKWVLIPGFSAIIILGIVFLCKNSEEMRIIFGIVLLDVTVALLLVGGMFGLCNFVIKHKTT